MTEIGSRIRLARIVNPSTGRTLILPVDHPIEDPSLTELNDPVPVVHALAGTGVNAFLMRRGTARAAVQEFAGRCGWVQRITGRTGLSSTGMAHGDARQLVLADVEEAARNGADAVVPTLFFGPETEDYALPELGRIADECMRHNLPLIAEIFPFGDASSVPYDGPYSVDDMRLAVRIASEEGADLIKTMYTGDIESFRKVLEYSLVPVIVAGGPKGDNEREILQTVRDALDAGAAGVAYGRKIWGANRPVKLARAIARMIHEDLSVETATREELG
jgi:fructose-bisphosphate aldolase/2-amino-3,7-dideoxy-D-threo-hept-6-ulosonate synthase